MNNIKLPPLKKQGSLKNKFKSLNTSVNSLSSQLHKNISVTPSGKTNKKTSKNVDIKKSKFYIQSLQKYGQTPQEETKNDQHKDNDNDKLTSIDLDFSSHMNQQKSKNHKQKNYFLNKKKEENNDPDEQSTENLSVISSESKGALSVGYTHKHGKRNCPTLPYYHLIYGKVNDAEKFNYFILSVFKGVYYSQQIIKKTDSSASIAESKKVVLDIPSNGKQKKLLLLDVDETLIASVPQPGKKTVAVFDKINSSTIYHIKLRPYLNDFLKSMSEYYNIFLFSAGIKSYVDSIMEYIDPHCQLIHGSITRENCIGTKNGHYIKDLRIISNCDLNQTVIVDNSTHSFCFQLLNGVPILEWNGDDDADTELLNIQHYLKELYLQENFLSYNDENLKLNKILSYKLEELLISQASNHKKISIGTMRTLKILEILNSIEIYYQFTKLSNNFLFNFINKLDSSVLSMRGIINSNIQLKQQKNQIFFCFLFYQND